MSRLSGREIVSGRILVRVATFLFLVMLGMPVQLVWAQLTLSTLRGTVMDASGAVVPGADINLTDLSTNISRTTITDGAGNFEIPDLKNGTYR
ncbi:MAG TPA: carboxypeptidase-like regulatory domain-containing protein, partial [Acidobacteriota bacterium]|nr:carboxypeptidase-like regulatory domain-containing protein [Acidobacteriota bacterium]